MRDNYINMDTISTKYIPVLDNNNWRSARQVAAADRIMTAYKTKSFWDFVDEVMNIWAKLNPGRWRELIHEVKITKLDLRDREYATTKSKHMERRFLLRMPEFVHNVIWKMYPDYEMDRKFYNTFARRYPNFRVSEKV